MSEAKVDISPDSESLAARVAEWIIERHNAATGRFSLNLSGGSTPKRLYSLLGTEIYRRRIDWQRVHIFFGDERFVPRDHQDSNYRMVREELISRVPIPSENVHPVQTDLGSPGDAAAAYEGTLKTFYGKETVDMARPIFSVTLLGLGDDGHTASLFPRTAALDERTKWVTSVVGAKPEPRITMTYPVLEASSSLAFLVSGRAKREMLGRLLKTDMALPASRVQPSGEFVVFCDDEAVPERAA